MPDAALDCASVREHVRKVVAAVAPNATRERYAAFGVRVIAGAARFTGRRTVAVGDAVTIRARRFVIATGSSPSLPPIPGLESVPYVTEDTILDLAEIPAHLIVIGGSPTALALAQAFRWFGAAVTVLDAAEPLANEDPECAGVLLDQLAREGIVLRAGVAVARVEHADATIKVVLAGADCTGAAGEETITGSHLMVAAGRRPNTDGLGLAARARQMRGGAHRAARRAAHHQPAHLRDRRRHRRCALGAGGPASRRPRRPQRIVPAAGAARPGPGPARDLHGARVAQVGLDEVAARQGGHRINVLRWPYRRTTAPTAPSVTSAGTSRS